jgi:hypothetical protein
VQVGHEADIGLVDAHAEGGRGHDHLELVPVEAPLGLLAGGRLHAGVIGDRGHASLAEGLRDLLSLTLGGHIHDARLGRLHHPIQQVGELGVLLGDRADGQADVGPVKAPHQHHRVAHVEPLDDLGADRRRGRGGQGQHPRVPQLVGQRAHPQVLGAELVAPGADAVRLVDHQQ